MFTTSMPIRSFDKSRRYVLLAEYGTQIFFSFLKHILKGIPKPYYTQACTHTFTLILFFVWLSFVDVSDSFLFPQTVLRDGGTCFI